ncbi:hypothetical protein VTI74DRAFT_3280 [Chaetomium olivicolor]
MDHFNATVKDGKLVKTRRGLQVSRQKHNGLSFVNASPQDAGSGSGSSTGEASRPPQPEIKFIQEGTQTLTGAFEAYRHDTEHLDGSDTSQGTKRRRRVTRRGKSPAPSLAEASPRPSPTLFEEHNFHVRHSVNSRDVLHINPQLGNPAIDAPSAATPDPGFSRSDEDWGLFNRYFGAIPRGLYPYEDVLTYNPARAPQFYSMVAGDVAALHCVLMCGSIMEGVNSQTRPKNLAYHISKICAILNHKLGQDKPADALTLHCIATLAWIGCYVGRLDHWHLHMRGLQKVLDLNGGLAGLPPWLLAEIHKADLKGAAALASTPYLPFVRFYSSASTVLQPEAHRQAESSLFALLNPLNINLEVVTALSSLSTLASSIRLARQSSGTVTYDPHDFTEEWLSILHTLLTQPGPLRATDPEYPESTNPYTAGTPDNTNSYPVSPTENFTAYHRLLPSVQLIPATPPGPGGHLECALRITALLYLKELLPDWPRNLGGYAVLLELLRCHLAEFIPQDSDSLPGERHQPDTNVPETHTEPSDVPARRGTPTATTAASTTQIHPSLIDPFLTTTTPTPTITTRKQQTQPSSLPCFRAGHTDQRDTPRTAQAPSPADAPGAYLASSAREKGPSSRPPNASLVPVLTFVCLVGDAVSQVADINEGRLAETEHYPRSVYRHILRDVVAGLGGCGGGSGGVGGDDDNDAVVDMLGEAELAMVRLFEFGMVFGREIKKGTTTGKEEGGRDSGM